MRPGRLVHRESERGHQNRTLPLTDTKLIAYTSKLIIRIFPIRMRIKIGHTYSEIDGMPHLVKNRSRGSLGRTRRAHRRAFIHMLFSLSNYLTCKRTATFRFSVGSQRTISRRTRISPAIIRSLTLHEVSELLDCLMTTLTNYSLLAVVSLRTCLLTRIGRVI